MSLVFPENSQFITKKTKWTNQPVSLRYVLAVIYLFGGASATIALLSKFLLQPLMEQLTADRHDYASIALQRLQELSAKLSSMVSYIPPNKVSLSGVKYSDSQTQTESKPEPTGPIYPGVEEEKDKEDNEDHGARLIKMLNELDKVDGECKTTEFKNDLEDLESTATSLNYSGFGGGQIMSLESTLKKKFSKNEPDRIQEFKKEIRSIKGSLLSTRSIR